MSEKTGNKIVVLIIVLTSAVLWWSLRNGSYEMGVERGRDEQKKWDADWYAAHPVVKEALPVQFVTPVPQCRVGEYMSFNGTSNSFTCVPPKPQKGSKRPCRERKMGVESPGEPLRAGDCFTLPVPATGIIPEKEPAPLTEMQKYIAARNAEKIPCERIPGLVTDWIGSVGFGASPGEALESCNVFCRNGISVFVDSSTPAPQPVETKPQ